MKKLLSVLLSAVILLSLVPLLIFSVSAETDSQGVVYTLSDDGTYYIVSGYEGEPTEIIIPAEFNSLPVREIASDAISNCASLTSVVISDSVISIGSGAFAFDTALKSVVISDSVKRIGSGAFAFDTALKNINIPDSVTRIGQEVFLSCNSLTTIEIPDSVIDMYDAVFFSCENLTDIYCEAESQPVTWRENWILNCNATVHWGSKAPETEKPVFGNIDGDNDVDSIDYLFVKRSVLNTYTLTAEQKTAADIDKDGDVDSIDYLFVKRMVLGTYTVK